MQNINFYWGPVADGATISVSTTDVLEEDQEFSLDINWTSLDVDGSETQGEWVYIVLDENADLFGYNVNGEFFGYQRIEGPFIIEGTSISGFYNVSRWSLEFLTIRPRLHWHGVINGAIYMTFQETLQPRPIALSKGDFSFDLKAVADIPIIKVPLAPVTVAENQEVTLDLFAGLVDNVTQNGGESLSLTFYNVPEDSLFNTGQPIPGNGWTITDIAAFNELITFTPPPFWSGNVTMELVGEVVELDGRNSTSVSFNLDFIIEAVASSFKILTQDIDLPPSGNGKLSLNVDLDDNRGFDFVFDAETNTTTMSETPEEIIILTFTDVPVSTYLRASNGGRLTNVSTGVWVFEGTEKQANEGLEIVNINLSKGTYEVAVEGITKDVDDFLPSPISDDFPFKVFVEAPAVPGVVLEANETNAILIGSSGNDILKSSGHTNQTLDGGDGMDILYSAPFPKTLTGGPGRDVFVWNNAGDLAGGFDTITDFSVVDGDQLDLSGVIDPLFDLQLDTNNVSKFIQLVPGDNHTILKVNDGSQVVEVVRLNGVVFTNSDVQSLWDLGNLLL